MGCGYQKCWMEDTHRRSYRQFLTELTIQFADTYIELRGVGQDQLGLTAGTGTARFTVLTLSLEPWWLHHIDGRERMSGHDERRYRRGQCVVLNPRELETTFGAITTVRPTSPAVDQAVPPRSPATPQARNVQDSQKR